MSATWDTIKVGQFQRLYDLEAKKWGDDTTELDREIARIAILTDRSEDEVGDMSVDEFADVRREMSSLSEPPPSDRLVGEFRIGRSRFRINTDARTINAGQYNEAVHFLRGGEDAITRNLHFIMATLVVEERRRWFRWRRVERPHAERAEMMKDAPFIVCYHAALFFCRVYEELFGSLRTYFLKEMMKEGKTLEEAETAYMASWTLMRGSITP